NATWKNFNVIDMFSGSVNTLDFHVQGWSGNDIYSDLKINLASLPASTEVNLKILKRLCVEASTDGLTKTDESILYNKYRVSSGGVSILRNIKLKSREDCIATLEFILPDSIPDGGYEVSVTQVVNNLEMGQITQLLAVGDHPFVANINTGELHNNTCQWVQKMSSRNKVAYKELSRAIKHNYNGCRYCLPAYDTG
ncbi:peptidase C13 family protein, partial [Chloroflexota bacterium]